MRALPKNDSRLTAAQRIACWPARPGRRHRPRRRTRDTTADRPRSRADSGLRSVRAAGRIEGRSEAHRSRVWWIGWAYGPSAIVGFVASSMMCVVAPHGSKDTLYGKAPYLAWPICLALAGCGARTELAAVEIVPPAQGTTMDSVARTDPGLR